ncbi:hypothetical protein ACFWY9_23945 [Amycolatopsis sp. NPDC059027]|uniref:hypothetical protein n=1 Tax=Amycolatopsis sp. NPDC059027 TaxID=3346709 RepID=UPI00366C5EF7
MTNDGRFGFLISPTVGRGMFRFQLIIDGNLIGDEEPCLLGTAMRQLGSIADLKDRRLDALSSDPTSVLFTLRSDEELHDRTTVALAESFDSWRINAYRHEGRVVFLATEVRKNEPPSLILVSTVDLIEYNQIVNSVRSCWESH